MRNKGYTLIELTLVVAILGILGALAMPAYQAHASDTKASTARSNLLALRAQIALYKTQHDGALPGTVNGAGVAEGYLELQLVGTSDVMGIASDSRIPAGTYVCGPYLVRLPENPLNGASAFMYSTDFAADAGAANIGWLYNRTTGQLALNDPGTDADGVAYIDY